MLNNVLLENVFECQDQSHLEERVNILCISRDPGGRAG